MLGYFGNPLPKQPSHPNAPPSKPGPTSSCGPLFCNFHPLHPLSPPPPPNPPSLKSHSYFRWGPSGHSSQKDRKKIYPSSLEWKKNSPPHKNSLPGLFTSTITLRKPQEVLFFGGGLLLNQSPTKPKIIKRR